MLCLLQISWKCPLDILLVLDVVANVVYALVWRVYSLALLVSFDAS